MTDIGGCCRREAVFFRDTTGLRSSSFLSIEGEATSFLAKSKAVPGVFGVFAAPPKLANAPLPRPNAPPGLAVALPEVMLPTRFADGVCSPLSTFEGRDLSVERESLLVLR